MPNTNQTLFIVILVIIFTIVLIGIFYLMNKTNNRRRELFDIEQRLQEKIHVQYLAQQSDNKIDMFQPVIIKDDRHNNTQSLPSPIVIMTPHKLVSNKSSKRESILNKLYGFRSASSTPPLPQQPVRPSSIRPPSFLPMQEKLRSPAYSPPAYGDYRTSIPIISTVAPDYTAENKHIPL